MTWSERLIAFLAAPMQEAKTVEPPPTVARLINETCEQLIRIFTPPMPVSSDADHVRHLARSWCKHNGKMVAREVAARARRMEGYAEKWTAKAPEERSPVLVWSREVAL